MRTPALALVLLLGTLALPACDSNQFFRSDPDEALPETEEYVEGEPIEADLAMLWDRARQTLASEGYAVDDARTSYKRRTMVSRWETTLAPTRFEGKRTRAFVSFLPEDEGKWRVVVAVQRQRNVDIDQPSNAQTAYWEDEEQRDTSRADVLLWKIESGFRDRGS